MRIEELPNTHIEQSHLPIRRGLKVPDDVFEQRASKIAAARETGHFNLLPQHYQEILEELYSPSHPTREMVAKNRHRTKQDISTSEKRALALVDVITAENFDPKTFPKHFRDSFDEQERERIVNSYLDGESAPQLARKYGCSISPIYSILHKAGIRLRHTGTHGKAA